MTLNRFARLTGSLLLTILAVLGGAYVIMPNRLAEWALTLERNRAELYAHQVNVGGFNITYLDGGSGPVLVMLHGLGADKDNWTRVSSRLVRRYHIIAPDLLGHGDSDSPLDADYSIAAQRDRLEIFLRALNIDELDLAGSSTGAWIATAYAAKHPASVRSLWLLDCAGITAANKKSELAARLKAGDPNPLFAKTYDQFRDVLRFVFVHPPYIPGAIMRLLAHRQVENYTLNQRMFTQLQSDPNPVEKLAIGLKTPTLIVWGAQDRVADAVGADALHKLLPNSEVIVMPDIGHLPMIEAPEASATDYLRFRDNIALPQLN